jgi:ADP-ribose pyrophosphatase YjhB (NUDIX family)
VADLEDDDDATGDEAPRDQLWRVGAYAVCRRGDEVLLVRASARTLVQGRWFLPGGGLRFGEAPEEAVVRELREETGLVGRAPRLVGATSDLHARRDGSRLFAVRLLYELFVDDGDLVHESSGTSDEARWVPLGEVAGLGAQPYVLVALGLDAAK